MLPSASAPVIIPIVWWYRNHGVVVMNTTAFDVQWTRESIEWLGFGQRRKSSRGGLRRAGGMARRLEEGLDCAFTIDGRAGRGTWRSLAGDAGAKDGMPHHGVSHGVDRGKRLRKRGPFSAACAFFRAR